MNVELFERLLWESEGTTLDFKRDQYRFANATAEEKSEILKDLIGFANAFRRSESFILIGVQEVVGDRANVVGITEQLADHSLQQFVKGAVNGPLHFRYEAFAYDGKQVGVIRIELRQSRPLLMTKNYGYLKKGLAYIRRGSSTDLNQPATPQELVQMGREQTEWR